MGWRSWAHCCTPALGAPPPSTGPPLVWLGVASDLPWASQRAGPPPADDQPIGEPMPTHDLLIRGGTVVDGSGAAPYSADIAVTNGRITALPLAGWVFA